MRVVDDVKRVGREGKDEGERLPDSALVPKFWDGKSRSTTANERALVESVLAWWSIDWRRDRLAPGCRYCRCFCISSDVTTIAASEVPRYLGLSQAVPGVWMRVTAAM